VSGPATTGDPAMAGLAEAPRPGGVAGGPGATVAASRSNGLPSGRETDVYVIGDVNPDILVIDDDAVPEFGQVEKLVGTIRLTVGGSSAITACGLARLGLRVAHGGIVGDDILGQAVLEAMRARGVDTSTVSVDPAIPTGATVILGKADHRALLTATGTIDRLRAEDVPREVLPLIRHLHAGSTGIQPQLRPGLPLLFRECRAAGVSSSFDANWDPQRRWEGIVPMLAAADIFFPNEQEASLITGRDDPLAAAHELVAMAESAGRDPAAGPLIVALKMGASGALAVRGREALRLPASRVQVVDSTGAGDAFDAGFLYAYLDGRPLEEMLALAVACGTLSTRAVGGVDGQATLEEALALL
jgi:sugar/nucleoside kinase (ribokinase family)